MKRRLVSVALLGLLAGLFSLGLTRPAYAGVDDFRFKSFDADYYLSQDAKHVSQLKVVEKLVAVFPDYDQNHGLRRAIPKTYKGKSVDVKVASVTDGNGVARPDKLATNNDNTVLSIRSDSYLHGEQTYVITYNLQGVIAFESDHDEWYWDTNGDQWPQSFDRVVARAHIPTELAPSLLPDQACFTGVYGSKASDCTMSRQQSDDETVVTTSTTGQLGPGENLSFVLGFSKGTFAPYSPSLLAQLLGMAWTIIAIAAPPLLALIILIYLWSRYGRDPKDTRAVIAQYTPLKGVNPMLSGVVLSSQLETKAISATILDLCIRGYMKLYEVEEKALIGTSKSYELELLSKSQSQLSPDESTVVRLLFSSSVSGERVRLKDLANKLSSGAAKLGETLTDQATQEGYFKRNPSKVVLHYALAGFLIMAIAALCIKVTYQFIPFGIGLFAAGALTILFARIMTVLTPKGVEAKNYLKGLKLYMQMAEADRIKMLQTPAGAEKVSIDPTDKAQLVKLYEKLLPYAMLFGIEQEWAKQFADLYHEPPNWYSSNAAFSGLALSHSLDHFGSAANASFAAPSSSGSSGFGGGGFSGGGGGGGGGGGL